jgi:hypothetical protein
MMLAFTEQQMDRMGTESFLERMIVAIAESDPSADAELRGPDGNRILHEQYEKAHRYGLTTELELGQYIVTAWLLGTDFDTRFGAFQEILTHPTMLPRQKAEAIEQTATMLLGTLQAESLR